MPYAWPWDGELRSARVALVVAGGQQHFVGHADVGVLANIHELVDAARAAGVLVVVLRHLRAGSATRPALPAHGSASAEVLFANAGTVVTCHGVDGFWAGPLDDVLRSEKRDQLLIAGLGLETAVHSTLRSANDRGYECLLVQDACASVVDGGPQVRDAAISSICMSGGIFGAIATSSAVLEALRRLPTTPAPTTERPSS